MSHPFSLLLVCKVENTQSQYLLWRTTTGYARAIINDPTILLADEPTGNLDAMAVEVMEILQVIQLRGTTVMVATHVLL